MPEVLHPIPAPILAVSGRRKTVKIPVPQETETIADETEESTE
jgi:hypothetical protein